MHDNDLQELLPFDEKVRYAAAVQSYVRVLRNSQDFKWDADNLEAYVKDRIRTTPPRCIQRQWDHWEQVSDDGQNGAKRVVSRVCAFVTGILKCRQGFCVASPRRIVRQARHRNS